MAEPKERPILFSGPMVRALLAGQKAQTRRVVTHLDRDGLRLLGRLARVGGYRLDDASDRAAAAEACPYGQVGDRLYVRETIRLTTLYPGPHGERADSVYDADGALTKADAWPWKRLMLPSIHCPRGLSRILLEVTEVRVERLQDISEDDARAEGVVAQPGLNHGHVGAFCDLWEQINGKRAPWASNPWVWVVGFKRVGETRHG